MSIVRNIYLSKELGNLLGMDGSVVLGGCCFQVSANAYQKRGILNGGVSTRLQRSSNAYS